MDVFQKYAHRFLPESIECVRPEYCKRPFYCVREALQSDAENPKLEEALQLLEKMVQ